MQQSCLTTVCLPKGKLVFVRQRLRAACIALSKEAETLPAARTGLQQEAKFLDNRKRLDGLIAAQHEYLCRATGRLFALTRCAKDFALL